MIDPDPERQPHPKPAPTPVSDADPSSGSPDPAARIQAVPAAPPISRSAIVAPTEHLDGVNKALAWPIVAMALPVPVIGLVVAWFAWRRARRVVAAVHAQPGRYANARRAEAAGVIALVALAANALVTGMTLLYAFLIAAAILLFG